jgi:hypothetical protein
LKQNFCIFEAKVLHLLMRNIRIFKPNSSNSTNSSTKPKKSQNISTNLPPKNTAII